MARPKQTQKIKTVPVKIKIDDTMEPTRVYSNYAEVTHSPFDFTIRFCDATPIYQIEEASKAGEHRIPVVAEIAIPTIMVPALIKALEENYGKHQGIFGGAGNGKKAQGK